MQLPTRLADGLVMRVASPVDADALAAFNTQMHSDGDEPGEPIGAWTHDLLSRPHPSISPADFIIVEDDRRIVSTTALFSQTWTYAGVPFPAGRPELVATHPDYRRRGLVAKQFEVMHAWSEARGELVQGITGIPWYYRQFGYEMCVDLGGGPRATVEALRAAAAKETDEARYRVRPATEADIPFLAEVEARAQRRSLLACLRDEAMWRYTLTGRSLDAEPLTFVIVEECDPPSRPVGFVAHQRTLWSDGDLPVYLLEIRDGVPWSGALPVIWAYLVGAGEALAKSSGLPFAVVYVQGPEHPIARLAPVTFSAANPPYTWFLRVPDVARFMRHVGIVFETRLAASPLAGYTGDVRLNFFRDGVVLRFSAGRLTDVDRWERPERSEAHASFPDLTFLHLLFGHRSFEELRAWYADCTAWKDEGRALVDALFEKRASVIWPIG